MVPPAVIAGESPRFLNQQQNPFYGYVNPQGAMMSMPPFAAFNNPYMNAAAFNQQNMMAWSPPRSGASAKNHRGGGLNANHTQPTVPTPMSAHGLVHPASNEQRPLSEKESKELKRKKANRESARRSKLRKKEEFENLFKQVSQLQAKGVSLRTEIAKMEGVLETLSSQNQSLKRELELHNCSHNHHCKGKSSEPSSKKSKFSSSKDSNNHGDTRTALGLKETETETEAAEGQESASTITSEGSDGTNDIQELEQ